MLGPTDRDGPTVDYRFTLANERTCLAWLRTALGVLAGSVLLEQHATELGKGRHVLSIILCLAATVLSTTAYLRWQKNEVAIRRGVDLPSSRLTLGVTALVVAVVCLSAAMVIHR